MIEINDISKVFRTTEVETVALNHVNLEVKEGDTPEILQRRVMEEAEWVIMPKAIDLIANDKIEVVDGLVRSR